MSYPLGQTPVPVWAAPDRPIIDIDPDSLPSFLFKTDSEKTVGDEKPVFLKQSGRWNSVMNRDNVKVPKEDSNVDPTLLDHYDLESKWSNRMDDDIDRTNGGIVNLDRLRDRFAKNLAKNPFFPIALRGSASIFAIISLGLACAVYVQTKKVRGTAGGPAVPDLYSGHSPSASTIFTIVIATISIVYLLFSLWDETFGKPLGLRSSGSKIKFVAIDLVLMCLTAADLSAAFDAMISRDYICPANQNPRVCRLHKAVISFIFATLVTWFFTFLVSTFRMIDRASH